MISTQRSSRPGKIYVTFELPAAIWVDRVYVCGDFHAGDTRAMLMLQDHRTGTWQVRLGLDLGRRYEFRYLIDGVDWTTDSQADQCVENPFGSRNSVIDLSGSSA